MVFGLNKFSGQKAQICEACQLGNTLDLMHSNVWGPTQNVSLGRSRYSISFIDDYTRHTWIYLIEKKSEVFDCFQDLKGFVKTKIERKIKCMRSDGGKDTFPVNSTVIYKRWEFGANSVVDTHRSKTVWPRGRTCRSWKRHEK